MARRPLVTAGATRKYPSLLAGDGGGWGCVFTRDGWHCVRLLIKPTRYLLNGKSITTGGGGGGVGE